MKFKSIDKIINTLDVKYTEGKQPNDIIDSATANILIYDKYVIKITGANDYIDKIDLVKKTNRQYVYNFPYAITKYEKYWIIPMDTLTLLNKDEINMLNNIPSYLQHEDIYKNKLEFYKNKNINVLPEFLSFDVSYTNQKKEFIKTLNNESLTFYNNILEIFKEYKSIFEYVNGDNNSGNYAKVNGKIILFDL